MNQQQLAKYFDHTLLKPFATADDVTAVCNEARRCGFHSVCINPVYVQTAANALQNSGVAICTVVGFPLGAVTSEIKVAETSQAIDDGATEIDMVIHLGALFSGSDDIVLNDIRSVVAAADRCPVKVILETCFLTPEQIIKACLLSQEAGASFVKTSTGFGTGGAKVEDIRLMRETVGENMLIKASGGITSLGDTLRMIEAGADRIGASASVSIIEENFNKKNN